MAESIHVDIVSAEGEIFAGPAKMVFLPAVEGEIGVAPRHAPLLTLRHTDIAFHGRQEHHLRGPSEDFALGADDVDVNAFGHAVCSVSAY